MFRSAIIHAMVAAVIVFATPAVAQPIASGDFNGDGYADLAIGVPLEDLNLPIPQADCGAVHVLYGTSTGLDSSGSMFWHQDKAGMGERAQAGDLFGYALAAGDFDDDGYDDLAIGVPRESIAGITAKYSGVVHVMYGSASGLTASRDEIWHQDVAGVLDSAGQADGFGRSLAAGDFDGDGYDDLAIGVPSDDPAGVADSGAVHVLYGGSGGLTDSGDQFWHQDIAGILDSCESDDHFGTALSSDDFNNDGWADLAIGIENEDVGAVTDAGAVAVLYGSSAGLSAAGDDFWHQDSSGIRDTAEADDRFGGRSLTSGDFNLDGFADLAIGIDAEDVGTAVDAGAVAVVYGTAMGLTQVGDQFWHRNSSGILGATVSNESFGYSVAGGDLNGDSIDDLAIGVPSGDVGAVSNAGEVHLILGSGTGLTAIDDAIWDQDSPDVEDVAEDFDALGESLCVGDFDGSGVADLVMSVPREDVAAVSDAGAVNVLYSDGSGLSGTDSDFWQQDTTGIPDSSESDDRMGGT